LTTTLANLQTLRNLIIAEHDRQLAEAKAAKVVNLTAILALEKSRARYARVGQSIELAERFPFQVTRDSWDVIG
jgi:hypothetical protein